MLVFLKQFIAVVMQAREFVEMSDAEKESVIEHLHTSWSNPGNEAVKHFGVFKERSSELLKVILES